MKKWEYKVLKISPSLKLDELNKLGKDGWELVTAIPNIKIGSTYNILYIFKRGSSKI
jgi:hypothetical protein